MDRNTNLNRRRFLKVTGLATGVTAFSSLVQACSDQNNTVVPLTVTPSGTAQTTSIIYPTVRPVVVNTAPDSYLALAPALLLPGNLANFL